MTSTAIASAADGTHGVHGSKKKLKAPKGWWRNIVVRDYVPEVLKILDRAGIEQPTIRRTFYTLAQRYPDFPKTTEAYKELLVKLTDVRLRRKEFSDWDDGYYDYRLDTFADDSRPDVIVPHYEKPEPFVRHFLFGIRRILEKYNIPYWESQKDVVEVMTEKQSMESSFRQITKPKQVAVIINKGDSSIPYLYEQYLRWKSYQQRENKNVHILFFSDLDTQGEYMHKNMIDKFLRMIELDVIRGEEEPLNWDWSIEEWDNEAELERFKHKSIGGRTREPSWHIKHYDPDKPKFTFERIGLTEKQANELNLTRLDEIPISELKRGTQQYDFAKRHGGYSFAVELDAFLIEQQEAFERIVNNAIDKYHDEDIWQHTQETCGEEVKDREVEKRVEFSELAKAEYFDWKKDREESAS